MKKISDKKYIIKCLAFLFILLAQTSINAQAHVYVSPQTVVLSGQSTITVDFMISNVTDLSRYSVKTIFDNSILDFESATKGPFLTDGNFFRVDPTTIIDSFAVVDAILGSNPPVSGSGKLFSIEFNVLSAGNCQISIVIVQLRDPNNVPIPVTWDSGEVVVPLSVNAKVYLQGPFNVSNMNTTLNSSGYLPLIQPYSGNPWNYTGTESVTSGFFGTHPDIVDWVLIELRTETGANTMIDRKAGFLLNNGTITAMDGISPLYFNQSKGNYYLVTFHRNHIAVMSSNLVTMDYVSVLYDFTNSPSKVYGNSLANLGEGYYGAFSGDTNGSGTVDASDRSNAWNQRNISGYNSSDVNLSGTVDAADRSTVWNNRNISSNVP